MVSSNLILPKDDKSGLVKIKDYIDLICRVIPQARNGTISTSCLMSSKPCLNASLIEPPQGTTRQHMTRCSISLNLSSARWTPIQLPLGSTFTLKVLLPFLLEEVKLVWLILPNVAFLLPFARTSHPDASQRSD